MSRLTFILLTLLSIEVTAQQKVGLFAEQSTYTEYLLHLVAKESFETAAIELNNQQSRALVNSTLHDYVEAIIELELHNDIKPALSYVEHEYNHFYKNDLVFRIGNYYFQRREYSQSISWFSQADLQEDKHVFYYAQALHYLKQWDAALGKYQEINSDPYFLIAQLEAGKLLWEMGRKEDALRAFEVASQDDQLSHKTHPYLARYYFEQKQYGKALSFSGGAPPKDKDNHANLLMIRGKSFQKLGEPGEALNEYLELKDLYPEKISAEILWSIAEAALDSNNPKEAVSSLNAIIQSDSPYKQLAAFKLGSLLVIQQLFQEAAVAFQIAREGADQEVAKMALLNHAKANFNMGLYEQAVIQLSDYQELYPTSDLLITTELIIQAHFLSSDYESTLSYIESRRNLSPSVRKIYQLVSYENAKRYFSDQKFDEAIIYLKQSINVPLEKTVLEESALLLADIYSYQRQYNQAIPWYLKLSNTNDQARKISAMYGVAYAYYNIQNYESALRHFRILNEIKKTPIDLLTEADVRIADCLYVLKSYEDAKQYYLRLRSSHWSSHVKYQLAEIYRLTEENEKAIQILNEVLLQGSDTNVKTKASMLLAEIYLDQSEFQAAIQVTDLLIKDSATHEAIPRAQLIKSIAATNLKQYGVAETSLKYILDEVNDEELVKNALFGLQTLQNNGYEVSDFSTYFDQIAAVRADDEGLIRIAYESAKAPYFNRSYDEAIGSLRNFIEKYGEHKPADIYYLLGDAYYKTLQYQEAVHAFDSVLQNKGGSLTGRVFDKRGNSLLKLGNNAAAIQNYEQWQNAAKNDREAYMARQGLISALLLEKEFKKVLELINVQQNSPWKPINYEQELTLIKSEVYENLEDFDKATDELIQLMNSAEGEKAAIAHLRFAKLQAKDSNYLQSNETLLQLIGDFGSYPEQTQAAYLQLIENYQLMGNTAQALAIAQSIIEHGTDSAFVDKASERMQMIIQKQISEPSDSLEIK